MDAVRIKWLAGMVALLLSVSPTYGQNSGAPSEAVRSEASPVRQGRMLEEVIVSARRIQESQQDVPLAITAMTGEMLEQQGVFQVSDLTENVPNLTMQIAEGRKTTLQVGIRGQIPFDVVITQDPPVAFFLGDVIQMRTHGLGVLAFLDIASVEVVKGPQGTLFGRNTTGGVVKVSPNVPGSEFSARLKLAAGWENLLTQSAMLNVPVTESLAIRLAAENTTQDTTIENRDPPGGGFYDSDMQTWRATVRWDITDRLSTTYLTDGMRGEDKGGTTFLRAVNPDGLADNLYDNQGGDPVDLAEFLLDLQTPLPSEEGGFQRALREQRNADFYSTRVNETDENDRAFTDTAITGHANTTVFDLTANLTVKNIVGLREIDQVDGTDLDGTTFPALWAEQSHDSEQFTEELQLLGNWERFNFIVGAYYFREEGTDVGKNEALKDTLLEDAGLLGNPGFAGGDAINRSRAIFAQGTYRFTPAWSLTLGARLTEDHRVYTARSRNANGCQVAGVEEGEPCAKRVSEEFSEPTWNVSLDWTFAESQLAYIAHRHGYRSGGFNLRGLSDAELEPFDPETVDDVEIGYKGEFTPGGQLFRFNAAAYYSRYNDIQKALVQLQSDFSLNNFILNAAKAKIFGSELELTWSPTESWLVTGFYGYTNAEYDEWTGLSGEDLSNNEFRGTPEHSGKLSVRYTFFLEKWGDVSTQIGAYAQSEMETFDINQPGTLQSGYSLYEARLDWQNVFGSTLSASVWGKNLADREYISGSLPLYNELGYTLGYHGTPRSWGAAIKYEF